MRIRGRRRKMHLSLSRSDSQTSEVSVVKGDTYRMDTHALALIAANPEPLRYSLQAFLATLPHIKSVNSVDDAQQAVVAAEVLCPALAVFDIDALGGEAESVLAQIKTASPRTRLD